MEKTHYQGPYHKSAQATQRTENTRKSYELQITVPLVHPEAPKYYSNTCGCFRKKARERDIDCQNRYFPDVSYSNFKCLQGRNF